MGRSGAAMRPFVLSDHSGRRFRASAVATPALAVCPLQSGCGLNA